MAMEIKKINAVSPIAALKAAFPYCNIEAVAQIPSDGYKIWSANIGDVTMLALEDSKNSDGTSMYICKSIFWMKKVLV